MIISLTGKIHSGKDTVAKCILIADYLHKAKIPLYKGCF
jgi:dephospho-CoA kinase